MILSYLYQLCLVLQYSYWDNILLLVLLYMYRFSAFVENKIWFDWKNILDLSSLKILYIIVRDEFSKVSKFFSVAEIHQYWLDMGQVSNHSRWRIGNNKSQIKSQELFIVFFLFPETECRLHYVQRRVPQRHQVNDPRAHKGCGSDDQSGRFLAGALSPQVPTNTPWWLLLPTLWSSLWPKHVVHQPLSWPGTHSG